MRRYLWPRTLLWRFFLLIGLLIVLSLFSWFQLLNHFATRSRGTQAAQLVVSVVNLTRAALLASEDSRRLGLMRELANLEGIRVIPAERNDAIEPLNDSAFMRMLVIRVQAQLGSYTRFTQSLHGQHGFFVSFRVDEDDPEDEYWLMLPPNRVTRLGVAEWLGWGSLAVLMSLLGAYLLVRGVTRPLKALENTARAIAEEGLCRGEGSKPHPCKRDEAAGVSGRLQRGEDKRHEQADAKRVH